MTTQHTEQSEREELIRKALHRAFSLGQTYWDQAESEYTSQHKKADETHAKFKALADETAALLAEDKAVGEPVAWAPQWAIDRLTGKLGPAVTWGVDAPLYVREAKDCIPLYTHPQPQSERVPLTEEKIKHIYKCVTGWSISDDDPMLVDFARAIEAAHGIGGKE